MPSTLASPFVGARPTTPREPSREVRALFPTRPRVFPVSVRSDRTVATRYALDRTVARYLAREAREAREVAGTSRVGLDRLARDAREADGRA